MLIDSGVWPAICAGLHQSDFSVTRPEFHSSGFSALGYLNSRHNFGKADNTVNLKFLHALEAKCQDCPAKCTAFHDDTSNNEIKVDEVDVPTTATVNNLQTCQQFSEAIPISGTLKRVQNASCQTSRLVDCNEISYSFGEPLGDSIDVVRNLIKSKRISSVLTKHLEEVAEFLRGLLHFGENGSLDLTYLTSEKLSFVNDHLKATWDLSNSLKHCLNGKSVDTCRTRFRVMVWEYPFCRRFLKLK